MYLNYSKILTFAILGPSFVSVFLGVLKIPFSTEFLVYLITLTFLIILKVNNNSFKIIFLKNYAAVYAYLFLTIIFIYVIFTISNNYVYNKLLLFTYLVIAKIIILSLVDYKSIVQNRTKFINYMQKSALVIIIFYFILFHLGFTSNIGETARVYLIGIGNPIWFSRFVGDLVFILIFYGIITNKINFFNFFGIMLGISLLFEGGSRAPILAVLIASTMAYIKFNDNKRKLIYTFLFIFSIVALPIIIPKVMDFNMYSILARFDSYQKSLIYIIDNPMGYGLGSFGLLYSGNDIRDYPHNIFLEIFVELGIVGFTIFLLLIYKAFKSHSKFNIFYYLFIISFVNAQFSGDLSSNGYMFMFIFLTIIYKKFERKILI